MDACDFADTVLGKIKDELPEVACKEYFIVSTYFFSYCPFKLIICAAMLLLLQVLSAPFIRCN